MAENTGKVREFCQSGKVGTLTRQNKSLSQETFRSMVQLCWKFDF